MASPVPPSRSGASPALFNWLEERAAGVLLHPTCLPGDFGIGTLDQHAGQFLEFLAAAGFHYWQMCPLGPTGFGDSPYQCFSAFAGNPYLIDPVALVRAGLIPDSAPAPLLFLNSDRVDFGALWRLKWPILFQAYETFRRSRAAAPDGDFAAFQNRQTHWLPAYGLFSALKDHFSGRPWWEWPREVRTFAAAQNSPLAAALASRSEAHQFFQYLFFGQWAQLKTRAAALGIRLIGDAPIFVALDSADVWASPQLFQLDAADGRPRAVAGVPPDYFSADGQLWGNPLYDWPVHAADGYAWWFARLQANFELYDVVRLDHFRGFDTYWSVPAGAATARAGAWKPGPGLDFFRAVAARFPGARIIAEDLGEPAASVTALLEATGLPGMTVLQFAFGDKADNPYLPHNHQANSVIYPGTHDNDTARGWYAATDEATRDHVRRYLRVSGNEIGWDLVRTAYASVCKLAVIPLQDLLSLGDEARFNTPGTAAGNWQWRYRASQLEKLKSESSAYLREIASLYGRLVSPAASGDGKAAAAHPTDRAS
ncbi:MAG TPA: 4-alpha-glucanotransferase [Opitutaceae bacterium]|nr:4-alpha-glucanotransferase [Opitutaceae bacterium]